MGRNKSYDRNEVLIALVRLFAESGYEATSIDQIAKATGMKRGSIYQAFDSKANLFRLALAHALESKADHHQLADLVFVALWERAGIDLEVRNSVEHAVVWLEETSGQPLATILHHRLFERAGITTKVVE